MKSLGFLYNRSQHKHSSQFSIRHHKIINTIILSNKHEISVSRYHVHLPLGDPKVWRLQDNKKKKMPRYFKPGEKKGYNVWLHRLPNMHWLYIECSRDFHKYIQFFLIIQYFLFFSLLKCYIGKGFPTFIYLYNSRSVL